MPKVTDWISSSPKPSPRRTADFPAVGIQPWLWRWFRRRSSCPHHADGQKSKGLEFEAVVILGVENQTFWSSLASERSEYRRRYEAVRHSGYAGGSKPTELLPLGGPSEPSLCVRSGRCVDEKRSATRRRAFFELRMGACRLQTYMSQGLRSVTTQDRPRRCARTHQTTLTTIRTMAAISITVGPRPSHRKP
jgi:hypothetical protein